MKTTTRTAAAAILVLALQLGSITMFAATLESGVYTTLPGTTVEERGDRVAGGQRFVPLSAMLTFDLNPAQPSLSAVIQDAVLEGGTPFRLTVRSSLGRQLGAGAYTFSGDYLQDLYPSGSGYGFDWTFSTAEDGRLVWNGVTGWSGGHLWVVTMLDVTIEPYVVPEPGTLALLGVGFGFLAGGRARSAADYGDRSPASACAKGRRRLT